MHKPAVFNLGQWSSGYDVALTTRRSHVQFLPGPSPFLKKDEPKNGFNNKGIPILIQ
jgi:hypothetical protein